MIPSEGCILCGKALRVNGTFILMSHCNFLAITEERGVAESRALRVAFEETQRKRLKPTPAPSFMVTRDTRTRSLTASRTSVAVCENGSVSAPRPGGGCPGERSGSASCMTSVHAQAGGGLRDARRPSAVTAELGNGLNVPCRRVRRGTATVARCAAVADVSR